MFSSFISCATQHPLPTPFVCLHNHQATASTAVSFAWALGPPQALPTSVPLPALLQGAHGQLFKLSAAQGATSMLQALQVYATHFWQMAVKCLKEKTSFVALAGALLFAPPGISSTSPFSTKQAPAPSFKASFNYLPILLEDNHGNTSPRLPAWIKG